LNLKMPIRNFTWSKITNTIFLLLIIVIYQSLFSNLLTIQQIKLDLPLLILVYVGLIYGPSSGAIFGFIEGLLLDLPTPFFLGAGALVKTAIGYLSGSVKDNLFLENILSKGGIIFLCVCLNDFWYYILTSGFDINYTFFVFFNYTILSALYTALAGLAIMWYKQIKRDKKITENFTRVYDR